MTQEAIRLVTPVGRIVWGSVHTRSTEDYDGKQYPAGEGPYQFGFAVLKTDPNIGAMLTAIYNQAIAGYQTNPQIVQRIQNEWQSGFTMGLFRFKIKDGDKPNAKNVINPNTKGHWVFSFQTSLPLKCGNTMNAEIDPSSIKTGYFVDIAMSTKVNGQTDGTAGVYLNPQVVRLIAFGEEITGGPSVEDAFKGHAAPTMLPPGASATPLAPSNSAPGAGLPGVDAGNGGHIAHQTPQMMQPGGGAQQNNGLPNTASNTGMPMAGAPGALPNAGNTAQGMQPGYAGNAPGANMSQATQYPINPQTGQPVMPHQQFVNGPGLPGQ